MRDVSVLARNESFRTARLQEDEEEEKQKRKKKTRRKTNDLVSSDVLL